MSQKIIFLSDHKKFSQRQKRIKMLFLTIIIGALIGVLSWHYFVENVAMVDVQIPPSQNQTFNDASPQAMTTAQIANEFEQADGKPIVLYIYTTWCKICVKNFPAVNEVAREFQNTDLKFLAIAIDRNLEPQALMEHLNSHGNLYFQPRFLSFKDGFVDFLRKNDISYDGRIPFTVLISRHGEVLTKFVGTKNKNYLRNKVIKELYGN